MSTVITTHHLGMASATREEAGRLVTRVRDGMARIFCTCLTVLISCVLFITQSLVVACLVRGGLKVLCTLKSCAFRLSGIQAFDKRSVVKLSLAATTAQSGADKGT